MRRLLQNPIVILMLLLLLADSLRYDNLLTDPRGWILEKLIILPGIIIGLAFHEFAHAKVSDLLGDPTPKMQGRVTVNPLAHIDPLGFLALLFIGFGWGQAVQINPSYYKKPRRDELLVSLAGVAMNLLIAVIFMGVVKLYWEFGGAFLMSMPGGILLMIFQYVVTMNVVLMVFNLMPIPPLDGFNALANLFNFRDKEIYYRLSSSGMMLLMLVILLNIPGRILQPIVQTILNLLYTIFQF